MKRSHSNQSAKLLKGEVLKCRFQEKQKLLNKSNECFSTNCHPMTLTDEHTAFIEANQLSDLKY